MRTRSAASVYFANRRKTAKRQFCIANGQFFSYSGKKPAHERKPMYFGVDYHPEQWVYPYGGSADNPEATWERDAQLMQEAGMNVARMGEFTWGLCEPEDGKFDFGWLRRV